jgi:predicted double-glycine peptidase
MEQSLSVVKSYLKEAREVLAPSYKEINDRKPVRKIKDADIFLEVPIVRQSTDYSCGAACFLSILGYYGYDPYEKQLIKALETTLGGTDPDSFKKAAKKFELKIDIKEDMTIDQIKNNLKKKIPVILDIQAWGEKKDYSKAWKDGHYVVAVGYDKKGFYLMDPSQMGYSYLLEKDLEDRWHDVEIDSDKKFFKLGIMIYGKAPKFHYDRVKPIG